MQRWMQTVVGMRTTECCGVSHPLLQTTEDSGVSHPLLQMTEDSRIISVQTQSADWRQGHHAVSSQQVDKIGLRET